MSVSIGVPNIFCKEHLKDGRKKARTWRARQSAVKPSSIRGGGLPCAAIGAALAPLGAVLHLGSLDGLPLHVAWVVRAAGA